MNVGKTLFVQVMEFVPLKTFGRIIEQHNGDAGVRTLECADLSRIMAFAQLTWRESLRDIEVCLTSDQAKLFHMGLKAPPARSTLADALHQRDWRIYLQVDHPAPAHQAFPGHQRERGEDANLVRRVYVRADRHWPPASPLDNPAPASTEPA